jgi:hypothetical protein
LPQEIAYSCPSDQNREAVSKDILNHKARYAGAKFAKSKSLSLVTANRSDAHIFLIKQAILSRIVY